MWTAVTVVYGTVLSVWLTAALAAYIGIRRDGEARFAVPILKVLRPLFVPALLLMVWDRSVVDGAPTWLTLLQTATMIGAYAAGTSFVRQSKRETAA